MDDFVAADGDTAANANQIAAPRLGSVGGCLFLLVRILCLSPAEGMIATESALAICPALRHPGTSLGEVSLASLTEPRARFTRSHGFAVYCDAAVTNLDEPDVAIGLTRYETQPIVQRHGVVALAELIAQIRDIGSRLTAHEHRGAEDQKNGTRNY